MKPDRAPSPDVPPPFLDREPPPLVVRGVSNLILFAFAVVVALAFLIELPVTVSGPFTLTPVRGADPVRAPRSGIVAEVAAVEGRSVARGDRLFRLRSELAGDRAGEAAMLSIAIRGAEGKLEHQRARHESQAAADRDELAGLARQTVTLSREIELAEQRGALARRQLDRYRALYGERLTGADEVQARELEVTRADMDLAHLRTALEQARASADRLRHEADARRVEDLETRRQLEEEGARARARLASLTGGALPASGDELAITSPCAGVVVRLHVRAASAVVAEADPLCELVCDGEELRADISIIDNGMGLVTHGQQVKLYYDAFPYHRHGVRYGTVQWIGPVGAAAAGAARPGGPAFRVLADVRDREFRVRGAPYPLLPGMTGRAEIIVARQSVVAFVLEPIRGLRERLDGGPRGP